MPYPPLRRFAFLFVLAVLPLPVAGSAHAQSVPRAELIEESRKEAGTTDVPRRVLPLPPGEVRLPETEFLAGLGPQSVRIEVRLKRAVSSGALEVQLPASWTRRSASGLPFARAPRLRRTATGAASLARRGATGRTAVVALRGAKAGDVASLEIEDVGIAAGTYELPYGWRYASGKLSRVGTVRVVFYAPEREAAGEGQTFFTPGALGNVTQNSYENTEPFVAVTPGNPERIAVGANDNSNGAHWDAARELWITSNAGRKWRKIVMPYVTNSYGSTTEEYQDLCCDPAFAADRLGNIWYSLISHPPNPGTSGAPSRIVVNRIAAGEEFFQDRSTGLPARTAGLQDKQMMTIDNTPSSPTYGRIYIVWNEPRAGGKYVVISECDTRIAGISQAARCDNPNNWSIPAPVTQAIGSYIYADVAVGPDGRVYVTWQDFSSNNAIRGTSCKPAGASAATCRSQVWSGWSAAQTIAALDSTGGTPIPFFCPTVVDPAGRIGPSPSVEVDHSNLSDTGRVYVTWSDLRTGSGTTKCGYGVTPKLSHLSWDSFVTSRAGALPGSTSRSHLAGRRLSEDGTSNAEEFLPWLAVDHTTGQAWTNFYSTKGDVNRSQAHHYLRPVAPKSTNPGYGPAGNAMGPGTRVSVNPSDYSFGTPNDYGDYAGLDATNGVAVPVWVDNSLQPSEIATFREAGAQRQPAGALTQPGGTSGCVSEDGGDCANGRALVEPGAVAVSPDNKHVYVGTDGYWGSQGIAAMQRNSTGTLTQSTTVGSCVSEDGSEGQCTNGRAVNGANDIVVSPDNKHVYATTDDGIVSFARSTNTGMLYQLSGGNGCQTPDGTASDPDFAYGTVICRTLRGFGYSTPGGITMSPDGKFVYLTYGSYSDGVIAILSRDPATGVLTQLAGAAGCIRQDTAEGCTALSLFANNGAEQIAISPDGLNAYVAGYEDLLLFTRNTSTGALTAITSGGCFNEDEERGCVKSTGMEYADRVVVSPDGKFVYVGVTDSFWGSIATFRRDTASSGRLSQPAGAQPCVRFEDYYASDLCTDLWNMYGVSSLKMSADGATLYAGHYNGVTVIDRNPATGVLSKPATPYGCISEDGTDSSYHSGLVAGNCFDARGLEQPYSVAVAPDGRNVYAASTGSNAVAVMTRRPAGAPVCRTQRAVVGANRARNVRLVCTEDNDRSMTYAIASGPSNGTLGTLGATGLVTYTPNSGFVGTDAFTYTATGPGGTSAPATIRVYVG